MKAVKKPAKKAVAKKAPPKKEATKVSGKAPTRATAKGPDNGQTVTVRKIANGFVTRTSAEVNGKYMENETFSKSRPTVTIPKD